MADAPLTCADLDEIERAIGKSALGPGPLTLAKLVAMARQGIAAQALADIAERQGAKNG